jgi:hypothetical protein
MDYTSFSKESFSALRADLNGDVIDMLNLIRLREHGAYADGGQTSGAEAYALYGRIRISRYPSIAVANSRLIRLGPAEAGTSFDGSGQ